MIEVFDAYRAETKEMANIFKDNKVCDACGGSNYKNVKITGPNERYCLHFCRECYNELRHKLTKDEN